jgi:hypothetical protein
VNTGGDTSRSVVGCRMSCPASWLHAKSCT